MDGPRDCSSADLCRRNGWEPGTRLVGDEGHGPTVIEITAVGEQGILAKEISHDGVPWREAFGWGPMERKWTLAHRDWRELTDA